MSYISTINYHKGSNNDIATAQALAAAGPFQLNGVRVKNEFVDYRPFNYLRYVSITSTGDDTGITFTVTGTCYGITVSQEFPGANATDAVSTQLFDTVTSVTANGATAGNVSVGTSGNGETIWLLNPYFDINRAFSFVITRTSANGQAIRAQGFYTLDTDIRGPKSTATAVQIDVSQDIEAASYVEPFKVIIAKAVVFVFTGNNAVPPAQAAGSAKVQLAWSGV